MSTSVDNNSRVFSPVILFHNNVDISTSDNQIIAIKKEKVTAMLKSNGQFWRKVIIQTRYASPPYSSPSSLSSSSDNEDEEEVCFNTTTPPNEQVDQEEEEIDMISVRRKRRGNLPKNVTAILKQWLIDHCKHPYPTEEEKKVLKQKTNLTLNQISNWFINARRRILPLILKDNEATTSSSKKRAASNDNIKASPAKHQKRS